MLFNRDADFLTKIFSHAPHTEAFEKIFNARCETIADNVFRLPPQIKKIVSEQYIVHYEEETFPCRKKPHKLITKRFFYSDADVN